MGYKEIGKDEISEKLRRIVVSLVGHQV
jgi:hypothetical protein